VSFNQHKLSATLILLSVAGFLYCHDVIANTKPLTDDELASPAAKMIKKVPKNEINAPKPKRFSNAAAAEEDRKLAGMTESITVVSERDPEDINAAKRPPMLVFRERLENERHSTPYEKAQTVLCILGFCGKGYGPEGAPVENRAYTRAEKKVDKSSLEMSKQFTGTYQ
jgi:hypothetical protein